MFTLKSIDAVWKIKEMLDDIVTELGIFEKQYNAIERQASDYIPVPQPIIQTKESDTMSEAIAKKKVALSAGHHPEDTGAAFEGYREHLEVTILMGFVIKELYKLGVLGYIIGTGGLTKKIAEINAGTFDAAIELHLNAGGGKGSETLYSKGSVKGATLASSIESEMKTKFPSRGAKVGWYKMDGITPLAFLAKPKCPSVIMEVFFIDGESTYLGDLDRYVEYAKLIASGISKSLKIV